MDYVTIIGTLGAFLILLAFVLAQFGKWKQTYMIYDLVNLIGSVLLIAYAILLRSYPFLVLNSVWAVVSLRDIFIDFKRNHHKRSMNFYNKWMK